VSRKRVARQLRADLGESNAARAAADARVLHLRGELTSIESLRGLAELLGRSLRRIDLDAKWATATVALIAQEIAVMKKLKELNQYEAKKLVPPSDHEKEVPKDCPDLIMDLAAAIKKNGKPVP